MLTEKQRNMIDARRTLGDTADDKKQLKYIDYTLRQYAKKQLDSMSDLLSVLEALPEDQLKKFISPKQAIESMQVVEKLVELLEPASIEIKGNEPRIVHRFGVMGKIFDLPDSAESMIKITFPAKTEEVELSTCIATHADIMLDSLNSRPEKRVTMKDYVKKILPQMAKLALERGKPYQVEFESATAWIEHQPESQEEAK